MKKLITLLYIHCYIALKVPKTWIKYILYCAKKFKKPDINMLNKLITISNISKELENK